MTHFIQYITRPENLSAAIFLLILWTLACMVAGAIIGILLCSRADKKIKNDNRRISFDDFIDHPNRQF